jgi:4-diphosphocytidyl-2C-methyl-D-erythritol kinase
VVQACLGKKQKELKARLKQWIRHKAPSSNLSTSKIYQTKANKKESNNKKIFRKSSSIWKVK